MKNILFSCCLIITGNVFCQQHALAKEWDKRFGGNLTDELYSCIQTSEGGYLLGGSAYSGFGGDKTQDNWDTTYNTYDFWVVKIDSLGNKQWDKRFGGYADDGIGSNSLLQTKDGGYVLIGFSSSGIGGDKTQNCWGGDDYWMVKIDSAGNKLWDKRFGGYGEDRNFANLLTADGGFILGGYTYSPEGGDISQPAWGVIDYWVIKTDSAGNKQWDARFGGTGENFLSALIQTNDGGYLLAGSSTSDSSGDKTQNDATSGNYNYWVVKIDSAGNKIWDKTYGSNSGDGLSALIKTADGGFLLGGSSGGTLGFDKTSPNCDATAITLDYWIIKIDSVGNKLFDRDYGGPEDDDLVSLALYKDGGFLVAGNSQSPAGCQKSENNTVGMLTWIIKTDSSGNQLWDKTIFLNGNTATSNAFQTSDGSYIISSWTGAEVGYYKTQPAWDSSGDYWIVKFKDTTIINGLKGLTTTLQFNTYPNPFTTELDITIAQQNLHQATFTVTNLLGQIIYNQQENNLSPTYTKMLDLSYLANGVYLVAVTVNGERMVREVVKSGP